MPRKSPLLESDGPETAEPTTLRRSSRVIQRRASETEAPPSPKPAKILRSRRTSKDVEAEEKPRTRRGSILVEEESKVESPAPAKRGRRSSIVRDLPVSSPAASTTRRRSIQVEDPPTETLAKPRTRRTSISKVDEEEPVPERKTRRRSTDTVPKRTENLVPIVEDKDIQEIPEEANLSIIKEDSQLEQEINEAKLEEKSDSESKLNISLDDKKLQVKVESLSKFNISTGSDGSFNLRMNTSDYCDKENMTPPKGEPTSRPSNVFKPSAKECSFSEPMEVDVTVLDCNTSKIRLSLKKLDDEVVEDDESFSLELAEDEVEKKPRLSLKARKSELSGKTPEQSRRKSQEKSEEIVVPKRSPRLSHKGSPCPESNQSLKVENLTVNTESEELPLEGNDSVQSLFFVLTHSNKDLPENPEDQNKSSDLFNKSPEKVQENAPSLPVISPKRSPRLSHKGSPCPLSNECFKDQSLREHRKSGSVERNLKAESSLPKRSPRLSLKGSPCPEPKNLPDNENSENKETILKEESVPLKSSPKLFHKGSPESNVPSKETSITENGVLDDEEMNLKDSPKKTSPLKGASRLSQKRTSTELNVSLKDNSTAIQKPEDEGTNLKEASPNKSLPEESLVQLEEDAASPVCTNIETRKSGLFKTSPEKVAQDSPKRGSESNVSLKDDESLPTRKSETGEISLNGFFNETTSSEEEEPKEKVKNVSLQSQSSIGSKDLSYNEEETENTSLLDTSEDNTKTNGKSINGNETLKDDVFNESISISDDEEEEVVQLDTDMPIKPPSLVKCQGESLNTSQGELKDIEKLLNGHDKIKKDVSNQSISSVVEEEVMQVDTDMPIKPPGYVKCERKSLNTSQGKFKEHINSPKDSPRLSLNGSSCMESNVSLKNQSFKLSRKSENGEPYSKNLFEKMSLNSSIIKELIKSCKSEILDTLQGKLQENAKKSPTNSPRLSHKGSPCLELNSSLKDKKRRSRSLSASLEVPFKKQASPDEELDEHSVPAQPTKELLKIEDLSNISSDDEFTDSSNSSISIDEGMFKMFSETKKGSKKDQSSVSPNNKKEQRSSPKKRKSFEMNQPETSSVSPEKNHKVEDTNSASRTIQVADIKDKKLLKIIRDLAKSVGLDKIDEDLTVTLSVSGKAPSIESSGSDSSQPEDSLELPTKKPKLKAMSTPTKALKDQTQNMMLDLLGNQTKGNRPVRQIKLSTSSAQDDWLVKENDNIKSWPSAKQDDWKVVVDSNIKPSKKEKPAFNQALM